MPTTPERENLDANERSQIGTLFPSLDGESPGEVEPSSDITGQPLPSLSEGEDDKFVDDVVNRPNSEGPEDKTKPTQDTTTVAAGEIREPKPRRGRSLQDRINILTRDRRETRDENSQLRAELQRLTEVVVKQSATPAPRPAMKPAGVFSQDSEGNESGEAGGAAQTPFSIDDVRSAIREEITSYDQEQRTAIAKQSEIQNQQEDSLREALEEFPELGDQRSRANQVYRELYLKSPLRGLPDAPYQVALQVRGILADESQQAAVTTDKKRQAGVVTPTPTNTSSTGGPSAAVLRKQYDTLSQELRSGNTDFRLYKRWRDIRDQLQSQQKKVTT